MITPHPTTFVHHMLVYLCDRPLDSLDVGVSGPCNNIDEDVGACRGGLLVGAWAVGGEVGLTNLHVATSNKLC